MIVKTCDRCGSKISTNPMTNTILPMFFINKLEGFAMGWQSVDLCHRCEKELAEWLNNKEERSAELDNQADDVERRENERTD